MPHSLHDCNFSVVEQLHLLGRQEHLLDGDVDLWERAPLAPPDLAECTSRKRQLLREDSSTLLDVLEIGLGHI